MTMEAGLKAPAIPWSERINWRIVVFVGVILALLALPAYIFLREKMTGGIVVLPDGTHKVNLKAMSEFSFNQENGTLRDIPQPFRELDGKRVLLEGEMWQPQVAGDRLASFELCYSIQKCCLSGPPQIQHFVKSRAVKGNLPYYDGPVKVLGTLHVRVVKDPVGKISSVYTMDVDHIERADG